jgi:F420H(2)-dependent quinone reductase
MRKPSCRCAGTLSFDPVNVERTLLRIVVWPLHRLAVRLSGGRIGATSARDDGVGTLILTITGRRSGVPRSTPLYYMPDGDRFVVVASNAGGESDPAWWLNLQASGEARVRTPDGEVAVHGREADSAQRERLWPELVRRYPRYGDYARRAGRPIPVVILEPPGAAHVE